MMERGGNHHFSACEFSISIVSAGFVFSYIMDLQIIIQSLNNIILESFNSHQSHCLLPLSISYIKAMYYTLS